MADDVIAIVLGLVIPVAVVMAIALLIPARADKWAADHPVAARRIAIVNVALGLTVAVLWAGRFVGLW
ncbi:MAG TPA: hypothetical protein VLM76_09920 [Patescibacteria group bacterium]|nr:hypothetical protein [Patescibacteria group bacterium]